MDFNGKHVVLTGASSGIGREMALILGGKGARLILIARRENELKQVAKEVVVAGAMEVVLVVADLGTRDGCRHAIQQVESTWPSIDVLLLVHGSTSVKPFGGLEGSDLDFAEKLMFVNFHSNQRLISALHPRVAKGGSIAAMASLAAIVGPPNRSLYAPTKAALRSFFQVLAHDLREQGLFFTLLTPGYVKTETHDVAHGSAKRNDMTAFMTAQLCASMSLDAVAKGRREFRYEWIPTLMTVVEGFSLYTGILDGFVRRKADQGVKPAGAP